MATENDLGTQPFLNDSTKHTKPRFWYITGRQIYMLKHCPYKQQLQVEIMI